MNAAPVSRERRRKKRRMLPPPEPAALAALDPDRPANRPMPAAEVLGRGQDDDVNEYFEPSILDAVPATPATDYFPHPSSDVESDKVYTLEPDWAKVFNTNPVPDWIRARMPHKDAAAPLTPSPWFDGSATLWQNIPDSVRTLAGAPAASASASAAAARGGDARLDDLQKRVDAMFAKLDDLNGNAASTHMEIIMFVLGGLLLLLLIDLLVKQGTQASLLLAGGFGGRAVGGLFT